MEDEGAPPGGEDDPKLYADPTGASHLPALDQSARAILYCASGGRSALACALLGQLGRHGLSDLGCFSLIPMHAYPRSLASVSEGDWIA